MKALLLVCAVLAAEPDAGRPLDAPVALRQGDPMPWNGLALSDDQAIEQAKQKVTLRTELGEVKKVFIISTTSAFVSALVTGVALGFCAADRGHCGLSHPPPAQ